jgi:hypothetical protein
MSIVVCGNEQLWVNDSEPYHGVFVSKIDSLLNFYDLPYSEYKQWFGSFFDDSNSRSDCVGESIEYFYRDALPDGTCSLDAATPNPKVNVSDFNLNSHSTLKFLYPVPYDTFEFCLQAKSFGDIVASKKMKITACGFETLYPKHS